MASRSKIIWKTFHTSISRLKQKRINYIHQNKGRLRLITICLKTQTELSKYTSSHLGVSGVSGMSFGTFSGKEKNNRGKTCKSNAPNALNAHLLFVDS